MSLARAMIEEPLGTRFSVQSARDRIGFDEPGWVVTDKMTGLMIRTGMALSLSEARDRLLDAAQRAEPDRAGLLKPTLTGPRVIKRYPN